MTKENFTNLLKAYLTEPEYAKVDYQSDDTLRVELDDKSIFIITVEGPSHADAL